MSEIPKEVQRKALEDVIKNAEKLLASGDERLNRIMPQPEYNGITAREALADSITRFKKQLKEMNAKDS